MKKAFILLIIIFSYFNLAAEENSYEDQKLLKSIVEKKNITKHKAAISKHALSKVEEDAYRILGNTPTDSPYKILGIKKGISRSEIQKIYQAQRNMWQNTKDLNPTLANKIIEILDHSYESVLLGAQGEESAAAKISSNKIREIFDKELPSLNDDLKKVIAKASKAITEAQKEEEKRIKAAQERAKRIERMRPQAPISFGREYGGEDYIPQRSSSGGYETPSYELPAEYYGGGVGAPMFGGYEDFGGGFGGGGFGEGNFGEKGGFGGGGGGREEGTIGEEKEGAKAETPKEAEKEKEKEKVESDEAKEINIKNTVIDISKKIKTETSTKKIDELLDEADSNIDALVGLKIGLDPKRKKQLKWVDLDKKYKSAIDTLEPYKKKKAERDKTKGEEKEKKAAPVTPLEHSEAKEENIKTSIIEMIQKLENATNKDEIEELIEEIDIYIEILKQVQIGLSPTRKLNKSWMGLDRNYNNALKTFENIKKKYAPKEVSGEELLKSNVGQSLMTLDQFASNLKTKSMNNAELIEDRLRYIRDLLADLEKRAESAKTTNEIETALTLMQQLEKNISQLDKEILSLIFDANSLNSQLQSLLSSNPGLRTLNKQIFEIENKLNFVLQMTRQYQIKLSEFNNKRKELLEKISKKKGS